MKKHLLYMSLLIIPALGILVKENHQINQPSKENSETNFFTCCERQPKAETTWESESESKSGRQLTYFWAEHADSQTN